MAQQVLDAIPKLLRDDDANPQPHVGEHEALFRMTLGEQFRPVKMAIDGLALDEALETIQRNQK